jgi:hypothetical protein
MPHPLSQFSLEGFGMKQHLRKRFVVSVVLALCASPVIADPAACSEAIQNYQELRSRSEMEESVFASTVEADAVRTNCTEQAAAEVPLKATPSQLASGPVTQVPSPTTPPSPLSVTPISPLGATPQSPLGATPASPLGATPPSPLAAVPPPITSSPSPLDALQPPANTTLQSPSNLTLQPPAGGTLAVSGAQPGSKASQLNAAEKVRVR